VSVTPDTPLPLPTGGPATLSGVKLRSKINDGVEDAELTDLVAALNAAIRRWPVADDFRGAEAWSPDVILGANMLGARLWRRKSTPGGVEVFGDGGMAYVRRTDPDVAMLLNIGDDWAKPAVN
jgi:hypothetical protein